MADDGNRVGFSLRDAFVLLYAKRGSGKSRVLRYLLACERDAFDEVFLICPTEEINGFYDGFIDKTRIHKEYSEAWAKMLLDKMTRINKGRQPTDPGFKRCLVLLDDIAADLDLTNRARFLQLGRLVKRGRHMGVALVCTCQYPNDFGKGGRTNADYTLIGQLNSAALEIVCNDCRFGRITKREWMDLYDRCTSRYGFLLTKGKNVDDNRDLGSIYGCVRCPPEWVD